MTSAPIVITSELLSQREARNVVMISSEEILRLRTDAYTSSKSEIGFLIRQPCELSRLVLVLVLQLRELVQSVYQQLSILHRMRAISSANRLPFQTLDKDRMHQDH